MQAVKASAVASSCSKDPSLPTQDGVRQFFPLLQYATFYWESDEHAGSLPLVYPNTTKGHSHCPQESPITCTAPERMGASLAGPGNGLVPRELSGGTRKTPSLRRPY